VGSVYHDGRFPTLRDVIEHYDTFKPLGLAEQQKNDLIEYLKSLKWVFSTTKKENNMKPSTKDQIKGDFHELKGKAKEKAGKVMNDPNLVAEGQNENLAGKVQKKIGQVEKVLEK
jgi:uncharacterized protein YjbJ (UPF0337 family)